MIQLWPLNLADWLATTESELWTSGTSLTVVIKQYRWKRVKSSSGWFAVEFIQWKNANPFEYYIVNIDIIN